MPITPFFFVFVNLDLLNNLCIKLKCIGFINEIFFKPKKWKYPSFLKVTRRSLKVDNFVNRKCGFFEFRDFQRVHIIIDILNDK